jgi:hypothetical protein
MIAPLSLLAGHGVVRVPLLTPSKWNVSLLLRNYDTSFLKSCEPASTAAIQMMEIGRWGAI